MDTTPENPDDRQVIEMSFYTEKDTRYPLAFYAIAVHLGIIEYTEDNAAECLRRAKAFFQIYEDAGQHMLTHADGTPLLVADIDEGFIRHHLGQRVEFGFRSPEDFDEHMRNLKASVTGVPRVSYRRIRCHRLRLDTPFMIYQEIDDQYRAEKRRVEMLSDGQMLWREDGYHGEGTANSAPEYVDYEDVPGIGIINDRSGYRAEEMTAEEFERLWERATSDTCGWVMELHDQGLTGLPGAEAVYCTKEHGEEEAFCAEHQEMARRMFPRLFWVA
ncbi:DUF6881 domain-containing protein [Streptomyces sp. NPDC057002]|uniref:DUF6881 domain-containing protein n=1 Tax=Streptomyces sp. NPDC057002 TaxID=3345992 RepID=UPI00363E7D9A